jgi:hypothetical protein
MEYKGFTIETKKYKSTNLFYAIVRETGFNTEDCISRKQAINEAKCYIDAWNKKHNTELDNFLDERYENQCFAGDEY